RVCFAPHQYHRALPAFPTRRSSDLHQPQGHADVDQDVAENHRQHARHDEASHAVLGLEQDTAAPPKNDTEQEQHKDAAHKTKLLDRKSTRLNSSHVKISYAVFCLKK